MRVRLSKAAAQDVDEAWDYTAEHSSIERADSLLDQFEDKFRLLAQFPQSGRRREELAPDLRSIATSGFVILYQIHEAVLEIVRVVHGSRDLEGLLSTSPRPPTRDSALVRLVRKRRGVPRSR